MMPWCPLKAARPLPERERQLLLSGIDRGVRLSGAVRRFGWHGNTVRSRPCHRRNQRDGWFGSAR